jgi:hypothetical protein
LDFALVLNDLSLARALSLARSTLVAAGAYLEVGLFRVVLEGGSLTMTSLRGLLLF